MAWFEVGFDGRWQEKFDTLEEATEWAKEVAATGRVVDVVRKRRFLSREFVTAFPESEHDRRKMAYSIAQAVGLMGYGGGS